MFRVDWLPVALPTWDELARGWSRTIGHRFQSNLRSTDVVVCYFCPNISDPCIVLIRLNSAWGFFAALSIFSFQNTSRRIWIPVGTAAGIITILIVWCIGNTWDTEEREEEPIDWSNEPQAEPQVENGTQA